MRRGPSRSLGAGVIVVVLAGCTGCGGTPAPPIPVPTFATPRIQTPGPARRATLLPTDCSQVLPAESVAALLAQPVDAFSSHTVLGMGSPSVGLLERLDCGYRRRGDTTTSTLALRAQAYTDPGAASRHMDINVAAEGADARGTENTAIGAAPAVLLAEPGRRVLMLNYGRVDLTISLPEAVVPTLATSDVLIDLAQRVLPLLAPQTPVDRSAPTSTASTGAAPPGAAPRRGGSPALPLGAAGRVGTHIG